MQFSTKGRLLVMAAIIVVCAREGQAQITYGKNLLVNGDAESGPATDGGTVVASIPGWTATGSANVVLYSASGRLTKTSIGPANRGNNYFAGGPSNAKSVLTQKVDLSSIAAGIDSGKVSFDVSGYLGGEGDDNSSVLVTFQGAGGNTLSTLTLGPVIATDKNDSKALYLRRQIGLLPPGTRAAVVELDLNRASGTENDAAADSLSFSLKDGSAAATFFGGNLIANGNAEAPTGGPLPGFALDLPGWVRTAGFSLDVWGGSDSDLALTDPGPADRGSNFFYGGPGSDKATATQDIDVSAGATQIDTGKVTFTFSGWVGGYSGQGDNMTVTAQFMNWTGTVLGTSTLGPVSPADRQGNSALLQRSQTGAIPAGTRTVRVTMTSLRTDGSDNDGLADSLALVLTVPGASPVPSIQSGGVVSASAFGGFTAIAPGTWVEIYGNNLATDTREWAGSDFKGTTAPTALNGTKVTIGGQAAFVRFISPGQVNAQIPSTVAAGTQQLTVTNDNGTSNSYPITVNATQAGLLAPSSFNIGGKQYVVALHADGTYVLPPGAIGGVPSRQAQPGETILLYGIGFGAVTPAFAAGQIVTAVNQLTLPVQIQFGSASASLSYAGLAPNFVGLYQFNVVVPNVSDNDAVPLSFTLGGSAGNQTLYIAVKR